MNRHPKIGNRHPGTGFHYIICGICGKKMRANEGRMAKALRHKGWVVCQADLDDDNPQNYLKSVRESKPPPPLWNKGEGDTDTFIVNTLTNQVPGPPKHLTIIGATDTSITMQWLGPNNSGSGAIQGYKIEREYPEGSGFTTIETNTLELGGYYVDTPLDTVPGVTVCYRVSAINNAGTGNPSETACLDRDPTVDLIINESGTDYILTEDGDYITPDE